MKVKTNVKTCQSEFFMYEPELLEMSERKILLTMRYMPPIRTQVFEIDKRNR